MNCIRVALFDMDGVLYDSMPRHARAWHESMAEYGMEMSEEEGYLFEGMRGVETIKIFGRKQLKRELTDEEATTIYRCKADHYEKQGISPRIPGVLELQQWLKEHGVLIGVVTGSGQPALISRIFTDFKGLVHPEILVTAADVKQGKPKPDPYLAGMRKAEKVLRDEGLIAEDERLKPEETLVIENAPLGVAAGNAAGCFTIAVNTGPLPDTMLQDAGASIVVKTMTEALAFLQSKL